MVCEGQMVTEFNNVCFSSKVGDLKIVSNTAWSTFNKNDWVSKQITKYKIVHLDKDVLPSSETKDYYYYFNDFITAFKSLDTSFSLSKIRINWLEKMLM